MAQQTKRGSNRSSSAATANGRSAANGRSSAAKKQQSRQTAQSKIRPVANKLKLPAIAAGAAAAGLAGGLALAKGGSSKKLLGVKLPTASGTEAASKNLAEAAKQIGSFGERVGQLATEVRLVREGVAQTRDRSPIEVVLQGLTSRGD